MEWRQGVQAVEVRNENPILHITSSHTANGVNDMLPIEAEQSVIRVHDSDSISPFRDEDRRKVEIPLGSIDQFRAQLTHSNTLQYTFPLRPSSYESRRPPSQDQIFLTGHDVSKMTLSEPDNIEYIKQALTRHRILPALQELREYRRLRGRGLGDDTLDNLLFGGLMLCEERSIYPARGLLPRRHGIPTDAYADNLVAYIGYGAQPDQLNGPILKELNHHITCPRCEYCPIVPNLFLEVAGDYVPRTDEVRRACCDGIFSPSGIIKLQSFSNSDRVFDGKAYTLRVTLLDETLKTYAVWPTISSTTAKSCSMVEFHTLLVGTWFIWLYVQLQD
jgi:hypothetical protein